MGDSRAAPEFGHVDLDIDENAEISLRPAFGQIELPAPDSEPALPDSEPAPPPPSTSRVFGTQTGTTQTGLGAVMPARSPSAVNTRATRKNMDVHEESTRILEGDALANITRPPPAMSEDDESTRAWAAIDSEWDPPPSARSADQPAPSGSGVASSRGGAVAAMRELYASGDADGALALAATLGQSAPPPAGVDYPDASIVVEFGSEEEMAVDSSDNLTPLAPTGPPCAAPQLTLTERHSIPRLLKTMAEVSKLKIDHRAGFLLAHVDGMQTLEEILDICAMPASEALELIGNLRDTGVIEFE
jgi:hypothetical protein